MSRSGPVVVVVDEWSPASWRRASLPARKGYHVSHVITPDLWELVSPSSRAALRSWEAWSPANRLRPIAWVRTGDRASWVTTEELARRRRLLRWVSSRDRGMRVTVRALAERLRTSVGTLSRTLAALSRAGLLEVETTKGRNGSTRLRTYVALLKGRPSTRAEHFADWRARVEVAELEDDPVEASLARGTALPPPDPALAAGMALLGFRLVGA